MGKDNFALKNRRSEMPLSRSISLIEDLLAKAGAKRIGKEYSEGEVTGLTFELATDNGNLVFKLPSRVEKVQGVIKDKKQAERTAWKTLYEWIYIQVGMILIEQVEAVEIFLPYAWDGKQTLFQNLKESNFKALLGPKKA